jgi:crossover junction endodeoxyribonuclease RuvC
MTKSRKSTPTLSRVVLGIDPGFDRLGLAILSEENGASVLLHSECFETDRKASKEERLLAIGLRVKEIIEKWQPQELAIEKLFFNQNTSSALGVAEARGVILYEAAAAGIIVYEYSPQDVKIAVTSYGKADKTQVEMMVSKLIKLRSPKNNKEKLKDDEIDAVALGITRLASRRVI